MSSILKKFKDTLSDFLPDFLNILGTKLRHRDSWISINSIVDDTVLHGDNGVGHYTQIYNSSLGKHSYVNNNSFVGNCKIGNFTSIGPSCVIGIGTHPTRAIATTSPKIYNKGLLSDTTFFEHKEEVTIGSDVWIGANVTICQGLSIGDGAIIGANSIVTTDIPSFTVYAGTPARFIRKRFTDRQIEQLLDLKWWDKSDDWIRDNIERFKDIDTFFKQ